MSDPASHDASVMGLTIHYTLRTHRRLSLDGIKNLFAPVRAKASALNFEEVGEWIKVEPDFPGIYYWPPGAKKFSDLLPPVDGWVCHATPGDGSESVRLGLCRFAGVAGWRMEGFCKTQYASRHGWEHFLKCHRGVIELLWAAEALGLKVKVEDEGELWETGSHKVLRRNLREYDRSMAAFVGAVKDAAGPETNLVSPISEHPQFERLEAERVALHGEKMAKAAQLVKRMAAGLPQG